MMLDILSGRAGVAGGRERVRHSMTKCVAVGSESEEVLTNLNAACFGLLIINYFEQQDIEVRHIVSDSFL
jgi:hypothetical protein